MTSLQSEFCHLRQLSLSVSCLFDPTIVGSSHLKISTIEHCANVNCYVLLYESSTETLQMLEKAAVKETKAYQWHKHFHEGYETAGFVYIMAHLHIGCWWSSSTLPNTM
jgi:hypothetical protein